MTEDVRITITGRHVQDGTETEPAETIARGKYYKKNGRHFLLFEELLEGSGNPVKTTVAFDDAVIEVIRRGNGETRMRFAEGSPHPTQYQTPMGVMEFLIEADHVGVAEEESRITAETSYHLYAGGTLIQDSFVRITAEPWRDE